MLVSLHHSSLTLNYCRRSKISCDASDSLQTAPAAVAPGGRIIIRSGACPGNLVISRDWGGGLFVDKASKAVVIHSTIVLDSARFAAGVASNNTVAMLASLLSGNLGASKGGECGGTGRIESKGWNLLIPRAGICGWTSRTAGSCPDRAT